MAISPRRLQARKTGYYGLREFFAAGKVKIHARNEGSDNEFNALLKVADPIQREAKLCAICIKHWEIWVPFRGDDYFLADVVSQSGRIARAIPVWPRERYAKFVREQISEDFAIKPIGLLEWFDQLCNRDFRKKKVKIALFWVPGLRTSCNAPNREVNGFAEVAARKSGIEPLLYEPVSEELSQMYLRHAYARSMKAGPKGKIP